MAGGDDSAVAATHVAEMFCTRHILLVSWFQSSKKKKNHRSATGARDHARAIADFSCDSAKTEQSPSAAVSGRS